MAGRLILHNGAVVSGEETLSEHTVAAHEGKIEEIFPSRHYAPEDGDTVLDCSGYFVCPGFIDLHNQGGGGYSVTDGAEESVYGLARVHAEHGTTGMLLTPPIIEGEWRYLLPVLAATVGKRTGGAAILGIHAEGPFLNPRKAGCMPRAGILEPDPKLLGEILELGGGRIMEMTIAPELPGALDLIFTLARNGVVASLGHSDAILDDVLRAIDHGASHVTHFFNAMSPLHHREPGLVGAALYSTDLSIELVADGNHVHPWIMGLTVQNKTVMLSCLVTDAMSPTGLPDGEYDSLGMKVRSDRGRLSLADHPETLAGSVLTMDRAVANMINMVGLGISDAVVMASTTPAAVLGLENRKGRLEPGYDADITVLDRRFSAAATVVGGEVVFSKERVTL
ncbi:MAG: N-acetylglucosamine-6-phosphate deacetylase [Candidatus Latescibacterota bacterium]